MAFDVVAFFPDGASVSTRPEIASSFAAAADWLAKNAGGYDGFLRLGSLDCSRSIAFLEQGLGRKCQPSKEEIWSPEELRALALAAKWPHSENVPPDQLWAYWSARKFVEVCVKHGLGIWFS